MNAAPPKGLPDGLGRIENGLLKAGSGQMEKSGVQTCEPKFAQHCFLGQR
jgi:hypothetical protein